MTIQLDGTSSAPRCALPATTTSSLPGSASATGSLGGAARHRCAVLRRRGRQLRASSTSSLSKPAAGPPCRLRGSAPRPAAVACAATTPSRRCAIVWRHSPPTPPIPLDVLAAIPSAVLTGQGLFSTTGAVHAAAAFTPDGEVLDRPGKTSVGTTPSTRWSGACCSMVNFPRRASGLFVSGRASFELAQKAWAAGFGTLVAVSAPTALAVQTARRAGLTLAGFVRGHRLNVYAPERVQP